MTTYIIGFLSVFAALIGLSLLVAFHEWGHYLAGRLFNTTMTHFSIGFGRPLVSKIKGGVKYQIAAIPLGGYVRFASSHDNEGVADASELEKDGFSRSDVAKHMDTKRWMENQAGWKQVVIALAGPLFSFLLSIPLFTAHTAMVGQVEVEGQVLVSGFTPESKAYEAGMREGDIFLAADGETIRTFEDLRTAMIGFNHELAKVELKRGEETIKLKVPTTETMPGVRSMGVKIGRSFEEISFLESIPHAWNKSVDQFVTTWKFIGRMITGQMGTKALSGPVGIIEVGSRAAQISIEVFFYIMGAITIALAVFNLLPLPIVDGGRALIAGYEQVSGRKVSDKALEYFFKISVVILLGLFLLGSWNDINRLFFS